MVKIWSSVFIFMIRVLLRHEIVVITVAQSLILIHWGINDTNSSMLLKIQLSQSMYISMIQNNGMPASHTNIAPYFHNSIHFICLVVASFFISIYFHLFN